MRNKKELQEAVDNLLEKGGIEPVRRSCSQGSFSRLFLLPKKTGELHPVIDLSTLNRHLVVPHFQMEATQSVRAAIWTGEWALSIDIRNAYLHVPMSPAVQKFLCFCINHRTYQFTCLPFSLTTSLRAFTKLIQPFTKLIQPVVVVQLLRHQGLVYTHGNVYLDDWLIWVDSPQMASSQAQLVMRVLHHLGWIINHEKSELNANPGLSVHWNALPDTGIHGGSPTWDEN